MARKEPNMKRIIRDRRLTAEEAAKYDAIREQIEQEKPEINARIRAQLATRRKAAAEAAGVPTLGQKLRTAERLAARPKCISPRRPASRKATCRNWNRTSASRLYPSPPACRVRVARRIGGRACLGPVRVARTFGTRVSVTSERAPEPGRQAGVHRRPAARPGAAGRRLVHAAAGALGGSPAADREAAP